MSDAKVARLLSSFRTAVDNAEHLEYREGLQAIVRGEGKGQIAATDNSRLLGSSFIDKDCNVKPYKNDPRWDYVAGYARASSVVAYFIEVHSAYTSEVSRVQKKLDWLARFLGQDANKELAAFEREYHWVASGAIKIPKNTPQYRRLQKLKAKAGGLRGPVKHLVLE